MNDALLVDTGFWIALFDPSEGDDHQAASRSADLIERLTLVVPWPIMYETLRTRFVRRPDWVARLNDRLMKPNTRFIDDHDYCRNAYSLTVEYSTRKRRPISMIDMLCRLILADPGVRVGSFLTLNVRDFFDVCSARNIELLHQRRG